MQNEIKYKGFTITNNLTGWYTCPVFGHGFLKADTLGGIKKIVTKAIKSNN